MATPVPAEGYDYFFETVRHWTLPTEWYDHFVGLCSFIEPQVCEILYNSLTSVESLHADVLVWDVLHFTVIINDIDAGEFMSLSNLVVIGVMSWSNFNST